MRCVMQPLVTFRLWVASRSSAPGGNVSYEHPHRSDHCPDALVHTLGNPLQVPNVEPGPALASPSPPPIPLPRLRPQVPELEHVGAVGAWATVKQAGVWKERSG